MIQRRRRTYGEAQRVGYALKHHPMESAMNIGRPLRIYENVPANPQPVPEPRPVPEPAPTEPVEPTIEP